jgi:tRNA nucleotidyltransferase (CCA-adding enzyme)
MVDPVAPADSFERYLVGGAVRDQALGLPATDRDWVVVGALPEDLLAAGYQQVGRDFPVFLHPQTHEEHALARTERKTGPGHRGFVVHAGPEVTLEEDLARRDLTVNAMAQRPDGTLVDPFGGMADLQAGVLRHVTDAFREDPLRVLRVARFAAQLEGFRTAPETLAVMRELSAADALAELPAERVYAELSKMLAKSARADRFFATLADAQGLAPWFAEFVDAGLPPASPATLGEPVLRFAALCWVLPADSVAALTERLKVPNDWRALATWSVSEGPVLARWETAAPERLEAALARVGAFRNTDNEARVLAVTEACGLVDLSLLAAATARIRAEVRTGPLIEQGFEGRALGEALRQARIAHLRDAQAGRSR